MATVLLRFWARRFAIVFMVAGAALVAAEWLKHGGDPSYLGAVAWAGGAALVAASIATFWAWRHGCAIPREMR